MPRKTGWHWHRYYVDQKPINNVCWISVSESSVFVHYLGDRGQVLFQQSDEDVYWGPLTPPD
jgi:hypothetical protein